MITFIRFENKPLLFQSPADVISAANLESIPECFSKMEQALKEGYYLAGFLSYEAGYAFEKKLYENKTYDFPLIHFGVYPKPLQLELLFPNNDNPALSNLRLNIGKDNYFVNIDKIRDRIAEGDVYQITYCLKMLGDFSGNPRNLFYKLLKEQPVPYPAFIESDNWKILSLSPEMFIKKQDNKVITKPMKGTWIRGKNVASDFIEKIRFQYDIKNRAENIMIADLLRNDLGRIGKCIRAPRLYEITGYKTLFQMTSTVTAKMPNDISLHKIFSAIFPSGSVTGAPKIKAMEIIRQLEGEPRRIYTGAIGYITPERDMFFNVPIRTILMRGNSWEMGIGGGIVWDSTPLGEWEEGLLKARFLQGTRT